MLMEEAGPGAKAVEFLERSCKPAAAHGGEEGVPVTGAMQVPRPKRNDNLQPGVCDACESEGSALSELEGSHFLGHPCLNLGPR